MKSDPKIIDKLNYLLAGELTAINQYIVHAEMCEDWGYEKLHEHFEKRAISEMKHAERLIGRILFLDGRPKVDTLNKIYIGQDVPEMLKNDHEAEANTIKDYNDAIVLAAEVKDHATRDFLQEILNDEDKHIDDIEGLQDQIDQMSLQVFLSTQTEE
ncbi:bacterioferritin [Brucepastera parasyntrophica]|uniref:bacterioferritin n=1 Tax=Brucepastera parasyntrophica TaxID=2880008 RepID=UPI00210A4F92|nr:bacterioferritin [Brucepastera parasyntrophica]ULQ60230.1 bacterioferritin [Brucepastera parasyntrophica]